MTPGIAAELWRPPIKLFAFDLILSFHFPRWTHGHTHQSAVIYPIFHLATSYTFILPSYKQIPLNDVSSLYFFLSAIFIYSQINIWNQRKRKHWIIIKKTTQKKTSKMLMKQWCYSTCILKDCLVLYISPLSLASLREMLLAAPSGNGRNTSAHTCVLFIFSRCWVKGPVQNGCHLSGINNSVT